MTIDLDNLEQLAKAALSRGEEDCESLDEWFSQEEFMSNMLLHPVDARFAEACKPRAMLELIAEVRRLREDAERYRWLREQPNDVSAPRIDVVQWTVADESANEGHGLRLGELDVAIDAVRAKTTTRDCPKCGVKDIPAGAYCKGMSCPLNPSQAKDQP